MTTPTYQEIETGLRARAEAARKAGNFKDEAALVVGADAIKRLTEEIDRIGRETSEFLDRNTAKINAMLERHEHP